MKKWSKETERLSRLDLVEKWNKGPEHRLEVLAYAKSIGVTKEQVMESMKKAGAK